MSKRAGPEPYEANGAFLRILQWSGETMTYCHQQVHLCVLSHLIFACCHSSSWQLHGGKRDGADAETLKPAFV